MDSMYNSMVKRSAVKSELRKNNNELSKENMILEKEHNKVINETKDKLNQEIQIRSELENREKEHNKVINETKDKLNQEIQIRIELETKVKALKLIAKNQKTLRKNLIEAFTKSKTKFERDILIKDLKRYEIESELKDHNNVLKQQNEDLEKLNVKSEKAFKKFQKERNADIELLVKTHIQNWKNQEKETNAMYFFYKKIIIVLLLVILSLAIVVITQHVRRFEWSSDTLPEKLNAIPE